MKQKLRSRRGATLMAALLFFLVAAVCGSIILAAATATLSRMTTQAEDARAYYSLTSAAQLVRDDFLNSHWTITVTKTDPADTKDKYTYEIAEDTESFIADLLSDAKSAEYNASVFKPSQKMTITTTRDEETLPVVYGKPAQDINFNTLYENYFDGKKTPLIIWMTNDPDGFENVEDGKPFSSTFTEGGKTRHAYWLELTFDSVKVPSGYTDKMKADGSEEQTFEIRWDNVSIRKLNYVPVQNTGTTP